MEPSQLIEIQMAGADARADGANRYDNPYLRTANGPLATGDTFEDWKKKKAAWDRGFCFGYVALASLLEQASKGEDEVAETVDEAEPYGPFKRDDLDAR
jgi:hypothetical protein